MIISYSKVVGGVVVGLMNQDCLGVVEDIVFKKECLALYALTLKRRAMLNFKKQLVASTDIIEIAESGVAVPSENSVTGLEDNVRIKKALDDGYCGINQKVVTKSGKKVGHVADYYIDTQTLAITKLYVKSVFSERIIPANAVREIRGKTIIISNDYALDSGNTVLAPDAEIA